MVLNYVFNFESVLKICSKFCSNFKKSKILAVNSHELSSLFSFKNLAIYQMGLDVRKPVFGGLQTTKVQTSQRLYYSLIRKYHI